MPKGVYDRKKSKRGRHVATAKTVSANGSKPVMNVEIRLNQTSQPLKMRAYSTYQKGDMFCVYCTDGKVKKYPLEHIFDVEEDYKAS